MAINIVVEYEGTDISSSMISYDREKSICTGIGTLHLVLKANAPITPELYKTVVLTENGHKKGTYFIHTMDKSDKEHTFIISAQDGSLKLQDYFVAESFLIDYPSTSDYWINKFLTDAGVSYVYDGVSFGSAISNNTSLGMSSAMDIIVPLLQQNGWYMTFDENNLCHIGKAAVDTGSYSDVFTDNEIIDITTNNHDKMFRNRIVVWGTANPNTDSWVFSDLDQHGRYDNEYPGGNDVRSVVISNSNIPDKASADLIAARALKEFDKTNFEITFDVAGESNVTIGNNIFIDSKYIRRAGVITTIGSSASAQGFVTHIIVNQRCPRLFSFFDYGGYVYVGTQGAGVWRKPLKYDHTWSNFSAGITDLNIKDLAVDSGMFAAVTMGGELFIRTNVDSTWVNFHPGSFTDVNASGITTVFPGASGLCTCATIDKDTKNIIAGFTLNAPGSSDPFASWIYYIRNGSSFNTYQFRDDQNQTGYKITAIDNNATTNLATVQTRFSGQEYVFDDLSHVGNSLYINSEFSPPSGYQIKYQNSGVAGGHIPKSLNVGADGKRIYEAFDSGTIFTGKSLTVVERDSRTGLLSGAYSYTGAQYEVIFGSYTHPVGNRMIAFPTAKGAQGQLIYHSYNFATNVEQTYASMVTGDIVSTAFAVTNYRPILYVLVNLNADQTLALYAYDVLDNVAWLVASSGAPSSEFGGPCAGVYTSKEGKASVSGGQIMFFAIADYTQTTYGDVISIPLVIFHPIGTTYMTVNSSLVGVIDGISGSVGINSWSYYGGAALGQNYYVGIGLTNGSSVFESYVIRMNNIGVATSIWSGVDYTILAFVGNKNYLCFTTTTSGNVIYLHNTDTGGILYTFFGNSNEQFIFNQLDDITNNFLRYEMTTGNIISYPLISGVIGVAEHTYYTNFHPNLSPTPPFGPYTIRYAFPELIFDTLYMNFVASNGFAQRESRFIYAPSGVGALSGIDHSVIGGSDFLLMKGYKGSPYITALNIAMAEDIESSQTSPFVAFGGTSFSGIVISGIQTGWNQGQMQISPAGEPETFTPVILYGWNSIVTDARSLTMLSGLVANAGYTRYVMFPQPASGTTVGGTTNLIMLDITSLTSNPSIIVTSGTLSQGYVYRTFSGYANHIETTNTQDIPYMFVSLSGLPPTFYQKDAMEAGGTVVDFVDRTNNLPNNSINIIRADDVI